MPSLRAKKEKLVLDFLRRGKPVKTGSLKAPTNKRWGINTRTSGLAGAYARAFGYGDFFIVLRELERRGKIVIDRRERCYSRLQKRFPSWAIYLPNKLPRSKRTLLYAVPRTAA